MTRLLIFTPTFGDGPLAETMESVGYQRAHDANGKPIELIHQLGWHNPFGPGDIRNVVAQYQQAREMVRAGAFDGLVTVEHDMWLPHDAIYRLWHTPAAVVYGVYMLRHGSNVINAWQHTGTRNMGMSLSIYPKQLAHWRARGVGPVSGVAFGCTLIRREVIERIAFRGDRDGRSCDIMFAMDCVQAGITQMARFDVECGHYEKGEWLMPFSGPGGQKTRAVALVDVNVAADGESKRIEKGRHYTLPLAVAQELERAGYVRVSDEDFETPEEGSEADGRETATAKRKAAKGKTAKPKEAETAD